METQTVPTCVHIMHTSIELQVHADAHMPTVYQVEHRKEGRT